MTTKQFESKCLQAEEAAHFNQSSKVYSIMRDILGTLATSTAKLVNKQDGKSLTGNGELIKELLNGGNEEGSTKFPLAATNLDICTDNFTLDELRKAINKMKPNKSPGTDFVVTVETLKYGRNDLHNAVLDMHYSVLNDLGVPYQWTECIIVSIPKKASKGMKDLHGISLMSITAKVYNRMLLNPIYDPIDKLL